MILFLKASLEKQSHLLFVLNHQDSHRKPQRSGLGYRHLISASVFYPYPFRGFSFPWIKIPPAVPRSPVTMKLLVPVAVVLFLSFSVFGQTATLCVVVTDESGRLFQDATITLTNSAGAARITVSGNDGSYSIDALVERFAKEHPARFDLPRWGPVECLDLPKVQSNEAVAVA